MAQFGSREIIPLEAVRRGYFWNIEPHKMIGACQKNGLPATKAGIRLTDLAMYLDKRRAEALDRMNKEAAEEETRVPPAGNSVVYFIKSDGLIKIGFSTNLKKRLQTYATHNAFDVDLLGTIPGEQSLEKELHAKFRQFRVHREWFRFVQEIQDYLATHGIREREIIL